MTLPRFKSCPEASRGDKGMHSWGEAEDVGCIYDDDDDDDHHHHRHNNDNIYNNILMMT